MCNSSTTISTKRVSYALTTGGKPFKINTEVHVGWCPPGTSNPVDPPLVDRSVRFRHTSAKLSGLRADACDEGGSAELQQSNSFP